MQHEINRLLEKHQIEIIEITKGQLQNTLKKNSDIFFKKD